MSLAHRGQSGLCRLCEPHGCRGRVPAEQVLASHGGAPVLGRARLFRVLREPCRDDDGSVERTPPPGAGGPAATRPDAVQDLSPTRVSGNHCPDGRAARWRPS